MKSHNTVYFYARIYGCIDHVHQSHSPRTSSDVIIDMLGDKMMRKIVNAYYEDSGEQDLVKEAVVESCSKDQQDSDVSRASNRGTLRYYIKVLICFIIRA